MSRKWLLSKTLNIVMFPNFWMVVYVRDNVHLAGCVTFPPTAVSFHSPPEVSVSTLRLFQCTHAVTSLWTTFPTIPHLGTNHALTPVSHQWPFISCTRTHNHGWVLFSLYLTFPVFWVQRVLTQEDTAGMWRLKSV